MKRSVILFSMIVALVFSFSSQAQTLIAKWTFPTGSPSDSLADGGLSANLTKAIRTEGGTSAIDFTKNGFTTKAAQATGWDNGAMTKSWIIEITTLNYETLKVSSKQQSGGANPGPQDFIVQYRIGANGTWTDVPNTVITAANNWTSGALDSVSLPDSCSNRTSLWLRWLMTTNNNSAGGTVAATGIDKIDDIYITGKQLPTGVNSIDRLAGFKIAPNPALQQFRIISPEPMSVISLFNDSGTGVYQQVVSGNNVLVNAGNLPAGTYIVKILSVSGTVSCHKVVLY